MTPVPLIFPPATPSELIAYIIAHYRYPTTIVVGFPKDVFLQGLTADVRRQTAAATTAEDASDLDDNGQLHDPVPEQQQHPKQHDAHSHPAPKHPIVRGSLLQTAVSRHIRMIYVPTVTHLRAFLSVFTASDSRVSAPPVSQDTGQQQPLLLVYGFLELHRDAAEWSAQGLSTSLSILVQTAPKENFQAAVMEPKGAGGWEKLDEFLDEKVPLLNGAARKMDGSWSGRTVEVRKILGRWCKVKKEVDDTG